MRQGQPQEEESLCALPLQPQGRRTAGSSSGNPKPQLLTGQEPMFFSGTRLTLTLDAGSRLVPALFGRVETHNPRATFRLPRRTYHNTGYEVCGDQRLSAGRLTTKASASGGTAAWRADLRRARPGLSREGPAGE